MAKKIYLTEEQLQSIVVKAAKRILAESKNQEELDEWFGRNIADKFKAAKDTFTKGGSYDAHLANRNLERSRNDIENLKNKYGVQDGQNQKQYVKNSTQAEIAKIEQKYQSKIQQLEQQKQAEIDKVTGKANKQWDKYKGQKDNLDAQRKSDYSNRAKAMNANPYANFAE